MSRLFGRLSHAQLEAVKRHVRGREVWDLGFGHTDTEPVMLVEAGATHVTAVDKHERSYHIRPAVVQKPWGLVVHAYYKELVQLQPGLVDLNPSVGYLSWPVTWHNEEVPILQQCDLVIYVGLNRNATACGGPSLWQHFLHRELVEEVQAEQNDLLVYGKMLSQARVPEAREERAAVESWSDCIDFP